MNLYRKCRKILRPVKKQCKSLHEKNEIRKFKKNVLKYRPNESRIFYLGITEHKNLGDLAQYYCIKKWINQYFDSSKVFYCEATTIVNESLDWLPFFLSIFNPDTDIIVFQSGYCTQDLGGCHELMHRLVADNLPHAKILMMPQTIFFKHEENRQRTSDSYDKCRRMLFLARDKVSYNEALNMFPHLKVCCYPDIVTSLIGHFNYDNDRDKIFICRRNDEEKYYSEENIMSLKSKIEKICPVEIGDTQSRVGAYKTRNNLEYYITQEIERMSHYKVIITDRYHGTIFSLCANTPVIIIKTNDHKVITGADWFKGVYDDYVFVADSLDDAYVLALNICNNFNYHTLESYFDEKYYSEVLLDLFSSIK